MLHGWNKQGRRGRSWGKNRGHSHKDIRGIRRPHMLCSRRRKAGHNLSTAGRRRGYEMPRTGLQSGHLISPQPQQGPTSPLPHRMPQESTRIQDKDYGDCHIGIHGNEKADKRAEFESILGEISGKDRIATEERVHATSRATRKAFRLQPGFNPTTGEWNRHSLSAYT